MEHTAKRRRLTRRTVDVALLLAMVTLMSHQVAGGALHEWLGLGTLALIVAHLVLLALGVAVAGFGLATFLRNDIVGYMAMSTPFASYDLSNPPALVLVENASVIALFAFASYHVTRIRYQVSNQRRRARTTRP